MSLSHTQYGEATAPNTKALRFAHQVLQAAQVLDPEVEQALFVAFRDVQRSLFVPEHLSVRAFENVPLPSIDGLREPRPSLVARVLGLVGPFRYQRILEIGVGSGYRCALLSALGAQVFALESSRALSQRVRKRLDQMDYSDVILRATPALTGFEHDAPFDAVLCWQPLVEPPLEVLEQLDVSSGSAVFFLISGDRIRLSLVERTPNGFERFTFEDCTEDFGK
ncbi:MAG: hypothetical protein KDD64_07000 [Bdellovibrionales bacterium]|nr:hypothetical protein [Bdellovibrionales bacterium]